jgi:dTDP-glucose 4,6-dehydratase
MRLLVTGGAGFVGANFVHYTLATRPDVRVSVLDALTYAGNAANLASVEERIEFIHGDVTDAAVLDPLVAQADVVVHLAAHTHNDNAVRDPGPFVHTNLVGTYTVLEAVRRHGVRLHHVSTDEVYGELALADPDRFTAASPYRPSGPYSATKAGSDLLVRAWERSFGVRATISHSANNYGRYQHVEKFIPRQITNVLTDRKPKLYGSGRHVRDWVHVDDHSAALWAILEHGQTGRTYLIGTGVESQNRSLVELILELMGRPPDWYEYVADRPGHDLRYALDPTRTRQELGWHPQHRDLRAGLAATIEWYRAHRDWWAPMKDAVEAAYHTEGR